jgi:cytochrome b involved in lipid metabolism
MQQQPSKPLKPPGMRTGKIILPPGFSPLGKEDLDFLIIDWAKKQENLTSTEKPVVIGRVTLNDIKAHKSDSDAWIAVKGKVYDITNYLSFHPGGKSILLGMAGKDATELFNKYHSWVNEEALLKNYFKGFLISG